ncbi:metallophosphoesterase family protein [Antribacter gilvus]|uniref:metallophosphoesterase family protein n=1 Tax=Antribacter gilvus TaxID=2304675 RepID=UPI000F7AA5FB|nr:metallophosphoesterase [Antribacter gilvus]
MSRAHRTPPRWVRWTLAIVAVVLVCAVHGLATARAELSLGPHEAVYEVTADDAVIADLGPLGTLQIDSPLPLNLGVRVTVKEIPADLTAVDQAATLDALAGDLDSYLQFFSSPEQTVGSIARALIWDAVRNTVLGLVLVGAASGILWLLLGAARRAELAGTLAPRTWEITAGVVVAALVWGSSTASGPARPDEAGREASPVFAGTALEGARITGRLAGVIDTYGGQLVGVYQQNEQFYLDAHANLVTAWDTWDEGQEAAASAGGPTSSPSPPVTPTPTGGASPTAGASPQPSPSPSPEEDLVAFLVVSDLHCNTGMTPLIREAARRSGADAVLNAGDTTMNGTSVESVCIDSFASALPDGVPMVVADGNHDSQITSRQERSHGEIVLDGDVVDVAGVRILGDRDPLETRVGAGTIAARADTPRSAAERLAETACEVAGDAGMDGSYTGDDRVDLLLIHTPLVGEPSLESGCVPFQVSGHTHRRRGPEPVGYGLRYISASTAGAASGQPTVGPLRGTAEMTVLRFDPGSRRFVDWQVVTIAPDASATISDRQPVPDPVPLPGEVPDPSPTISPSPTASPSP